MYQSSRTISLCCFTLSVVLLSAVLLVFLPIDSRGRDTIEVNPVPAEGDTVTDVTRPDGTLRICHRVYGDSGPLEEKLIPESKWTTHEKHGDKKGPCGGFVRFKSVGTDSPILDFKVDSDTRLKFLRTADRLKVYNGGTLTRIHETQQDESIRLNKSDSHSAVGCRETSSGFNVDNDTGYICEFIDHDGIVRDTDYFSNHSQAHLLIGARLIVSEQGSLSAFDFEADTTPWKLTDRIREFYWDGSPEYFLSIYSKGLMSFHELRGLDDGSLISKRQIDSFNRNLSQDGSYFYLVQSNPGSRTKTILVFDRSFKRRARWEGLPFYARYTGEFFTQRKKIFIPLRNGKLMIGNFNTGEKRMVTYPTKPFTPLAHEIDTRRGLLFVYGVKGSSSNIGAVPTGSDRQLLVYDIDARSFRETRILFSRSKYDFDSKVSENRIRLTSPDVLALQHPKRLELYHLKLD